MELIRRPSFKEEKLLEKLLELSNINISESLNSNLLVSPMNDGGMGSLKLYPKGKTIANVRLGKCISEYQFLDEDNVVVIASLNIDNHGDLYELDIWKTDFSPLISININSRESI